MPSEVKHRYLAGQRLEVEQVAREIYNRRNRDSQRNELDCVREDHRLHSSPRRVEDNGQRPDDDHRLGRYAGKGRNDLAESPRNQSHNKRVEQKRQHAGHPTNGRAIDLSHHVPHAMALRILPHPRRHPLADKNCLERHHQPDQIPDVALLGPASGNPQRIGGPDVGRAQRREDHGTRQIA